MEGRVFSLEGRSFSSSLTKISTFFVGESLFLSCGIVNPTIFVGGSIVFQLWECKSDNFRWRVALFQALGLCIQSFFVGGPFFSSSGTINSTIFVGGSFVFKLWDYKSDHFRWRVALFSSSGTIY